MELLSTVRVGRLVGLRSIIGFTTLWDSIVPDREFGRAHATVWLQSVMRQMEWQRRRATAKPAAGPEESEESDSDDDDEMPMPASVHDGEVDLDAINELVRTRTAPEHAPCSPRTAMCGSLARSRGSALPDLYTLECVALAAQRGQGQAQSACVHRRLQQSLHRRARVRAPNAIDSMRVLAYWRRSGAGRVVSLQQVLHLFAVGFDQKRLP